MHAEKCPVCGSKGKIEDEKCHGCGGRGWVEVQDSVTRLEYVPYYPSYPQPYIPYIPEPFQPYYSPNTAGDYTVPLNAQVTWC